jgi:predicted SAM-dependent methyltransferase
MFYVPTYHFLSYLCFSHSLEHVPFGDGTLEAAFAGASVSAAATSIMPHCFLLSVCGSEWTRVLKPDGLLLVAVPDLVMMAR